VAGLGWTEVALLEMLGDWHHVIEVDETSARSQLGELIRSGSLRLERLARAARDEPAAVRRRLKELLTANGYDAVAASIPSPRSRARFVAETAAAS
jgi:DnaJ-domain-containing protein 1